MGIFIKLLCYNFHIGERIIVSEKKRVTLVVSEEDFLMWQQALELTVFTSMSAYIREIVNKTSRAFLSAQDQLEDGKAFLIKDAFFEEN